MSNIHKMIARLSTLVSRTTVIVALVVATIATVSITTPSFAAGTPASYSCGTYGSGNYSYTAGAADCGSTVGAPNTGFATKLTQPSSLIAIIGSLVLIVAGIALLFKTRHKKQSIGFKSTDS